MNIIKRFKTGQQYMLICPNDNSLALSFPEIKIILYLKLAIKYIPPVIVVLFVCQYFIWQSYINARLINSGIIMTVITALFTISLPIQGILWLGKRASSPLPLNLLATYNTTKKRLIELLFTNKPSIATQLLKKTEKINFMDFMQLLKLATLHLGNDFDSEIE